MLEFLGLPTTAAESGGAPPPGYPSLLAFLAAMPTPRPDTENEISRKVFAGKGAPAYPPMLPGTRAVLEAFFAQHGEMSGGLATAARRDDLR